MVGSGARGMVGVAFGIAPGDPAFDALRTEFLDRYEQRLLRETAVFAQMEPILAGARRRRAARGASSPTRSRASRCRWSKGWASTGGPPWSSAATPRRTPSRIRRRCSKRRAGCTLAPADCVYVGDDLRDVQAGRAAGMPTRRRGMGLPRRWRADRRLGRRRRHRRAGHTLEMAAPGLNCVLLGPTWFRRGCGSGAGHAEHQFARKSTGTK